MAAQKHKAIWLGNDVAEFFKSSEAAEPVPVGGEVLLSQAQVTAMEAVGHRFAKPGSDEARDATDQAVNTGKVSESAAAKK